MKERLISHVYLMQVAGFAAFPRIDIDIKFAELNAASNHQDRKAFDIARH